MRTDMSILTTENEPHGFFCKCGGIIHFSDEELTPPITEVTCDFCGKKGRYIGNYTKAVFLTELDMKDNNLLVATIDRNKVSLAEADAYINAFMKDLKSVNPNVNLMVTIDGIKIHSEKAQWVQEEENVWRCSNCGAVLEEDYHWHYHQFCYHCGRLMQFPIMNER